MSIIQTIREKGAKISVVLIALALLGFILTDYVAGKNRGSGGGASSNSIGSVNGKKINPGRYIIYCIPYADKWKIVLKNIL